MNTTTETRRDVMTLAWGLYRAELKGSNPRTFADALAGAWRWIKASAARAIEAGAWIARAAGRTVAFKSMLQSPIRRSLSGPYANSRARSAGYLTSTIGR